MEGGGSADGNGAAGTLIFGRLFTFPYAGSSPDYTVTTNVAGWAVVVAYRPSTGGIISVDQTIGHGTSISNSATVNYDSLTPVGVDEMRVWAWFCGAAAHQWRDQRHSTPPRPNNSTRTAGTRTGFRARPSRPVPAPRPCRRPLPTSGMTVLLMESLPPTLPSVNLPPTMRGGF
jgi:hypothetical protein